MSPAFGGGDTQYIFRGAAGRREDVERTWTGRFQRGRIHLVAEGQDEQAAVHQHLLLPGQSSGNYLRFAFIFLTTGLAASATSFVSTSIFPANGSNTLGDVLATTRHHKLKLAQAVTGGRFESSADYAVQNFVTYFLISKIAAGSTLL